MKSLAISKRYGWARYVAHQVYYSLVGREFEWELMPLGIDQKVSSLVWSPLGYGRLTGKIRRGQPLHEVSRLTKPPHTARRLTPNISTRSSTPSTKTVPQVALNCCCSGQLWRVSSWVPATRSS